MENDQKLYVIESVPLEEAAVVWGKEVLKIREDLVLLEQSYYDQEGGWSRSWNHWKSAKWAAGSSCIRQRMSKIDTPDEWTEMRVDAMHYDVKLDDSLFTFANLRNPAQLNSRQIDEY